MNPNVEDRECGTLEPALSAFADDEVFGPEREAVVRHLAACEACRRTLETYRRVGMALRERVLADSDRDLSAIVWPPRRAAPALTRRRRLLYDVTRWFDPWPVLAGSAALAALVIGILWSAPGPEPSNRVDIERLDAAGPVMVIPGNGGRMTIIWLFDADDQPAPAATET